MKRYLHRDGYIDSIIPFIGKDLIKVLTGQRRVGKSYLLYQLIDKITESVPDVNLIYINKELHEFSQIKTDEDLISFVNTKLDKEKPNFLFIDEIQDITDFEKALRHIQASDSAEIFCTGSNANLLSGEFATLLSGRYIEFHVSGLSYLEFLTFQNLPNTNESLLRYIRHGSLPYLVNLPDDSMVIYEYIRSVYNTILYKDIISRFGVRNTTLLENLILFLMDNLGSRFSAKKISDYLKSQKIMLSPKVIIDYLGHFQDAFLIYGIKRMGIAGKKIFEGGNKFYFEDLGIRHAIWGYTLADMGKILENLVFKHLQRNRYEIFFGELEEREIDFTGRKGQTRIYIQVAYRIIDNQTHEREFGNLLKIPDNFRKIVVTMDDLIEGGFKGVEHMHIREFLSTTL
ncbi:MAG: ATP-binding protein [Bacteroidales bacterium]|nr:ATP-binding protein [Bacteroidales bacterium]